MATKQKCDFDKFYTKPSVAAMCAEVVDVNSFRCVIEPSAGSGAFLNYLPKDTIAVDIAPEDDRVIKQDFLEFYPKISGNVLVIGNPPFGVRGKLIKDFIKHSINIGADCIAFILPMTYRKHTAQKVFPSNWKLTSDTALHENAFLLKGENYHVPCCFQVWEKDSNKNDLRNNGEVLEVGWFDYVSKPQNLVDGVLFIMGASPHNIKEPSEVNSNNRGYWIKLKEGVDKRDFISKMKAISWKGKALSSVNGGVAWFTKQQINEVLSNDKE